MNKLERNKNYSNKTFEDIKHIDENDIEYWCARELQLVANLFRITQTESKLKRDNISTEKEANKTHYNIGKNIKEVLAKNGGTMPEYLPTPKKSLKELEKEKKKSLVKQ